MLTNATEPPASAISKFAAGNFTAVTFLDDARQSSRHISLLIKAQVFVAIRRCPELSESLIIHKRSARTIHPTTWTGRCCPSHPNAINSLLALRAK